MPNRAAHTASARTVPLRTLALGVLLLVVATAVARAPQPQPQSWSSHGRAVIFNEPSRDVQLHASGAITRAPWQSVWLPACGGTGPGLSVPELAQVAQRRRPQLLADESDDIPQVGQDDGGVAGGVFNVVFDADGSVPPQAEDALDEAALYLESLFDDPISVTIDITFDDLGGGTLGVTGFFVSRKAYDDVREALEDDMDASDVIQKYFPTGNRLPVRYNGNKPDVTQESRVHFTRAAFKAAIGTVAGTDATITFNENIAWDFDPSDGVNGYSFMDVLLHEVGHALGFTSGIDFREKDLDVLDLFRFPRTDGQFDYNPDSKPDFRKRPRLVSKNKPNDRHVLDTIHREYRASDGGPYQASHFREQGVNIGLMDPALTFGESYYPEFYSNADLRMFDAIGWDW